MANSGKLALWGVSLSEALRLALGVISTILTLWIFFIAMRDHHPVFSSQNECGTDPRDFLRPVELLEEGALRFIVNSHCANARYLSDGWIELSFDRTDIDVQAKELKIAGKTYYELVWVGGETEP